MNRIVNQKHSYFTVIPTKLWMDLRSLQKIDYEQRIWTFTNSGEPSGLAQIFEGESPFDDGGELEVIDGHPEGANIPFMPDAPQEFASELDTDLRKRDQQVRVK